MSFALFTAVFLIMFLLNQETKQHISKMISRSKHRRIHCSVPFKVRDHAQEKVAVIVETWGSKCDVLRFFVDRGDKLLFEEKFHKYLIELDMVRHSGDGTGVDGKTTKHIWGKCSLNSS